MLPALYQKRLHGGENLFDGHLFHAFHRRLVDAAILEARRAINAGAYDNVLFTVRPGKRGIGRAKNGNDGRADGGGNVHRAAVVGDDDSAMGVQFGKLEEVRCSGFVPAALGDAFDALALAGGAGEDDAFARETANQLGKPVVAPEFRRPARGRIDGDPAFAWHIGDTERKLYGRIGTIEVLSGSKVAVNGVNVRNQHNFVVEHPRTFAGVAESDAARGGSGAGEEAAAQEALQVNDDVELAGVELPEQRKEFAGLLTVERNQFVDDGCVLEQRGEVVVDEPGDVSVGKTASDAGDGRQGVNNVAERAGLDDEDAVGRHLPYSSRSARDSGSPALRIFCWVMWKSYTTRCSSTRLLARS